ncbi:hypothetical protein Emtol_3427 [Emticicia oligotrophica DSM 17448]|uniref:Uncharacterized protein n=1 Tax=Emticicia oligotrophica (strain DSM 17448 / CIP 109782 / MTCC 6937 / GPTSA100-15) TaxID=929562 RepID=A0ABM5N4V3_EMTOG|nr:MULTISPECIES: hypothetical protein [Emticicia]AFK04556.1 hypothetical protein Emtol_3427 [Emticicia oligotrophica DSM 17448]
MNKNTKNIIKALAIVLTLATATTEGMAQTKATGKVASTEKNALAVQDMGSLRFKLAFENPLKQKTKISLVDKENNVYFVEYAANDAAYVKAFNLSNLSDGEYTFVVELGTEKLTKEFAINTQTFRGIALASDK